MKHTKLHLRREAERFGAVVEDDSAGRWNVLQVVAPKGMLWSDNGAMHIKIEWPLGEKSSEPIRDAIQRIKAGIEPDTEGITLDA